MATGKQRSKKEKTRENRTNIISGDIIAAQNGNSDAWNRILDYFMPRINYLVYQHRPGYTAQDYIDCSNVAKSALLEAVMTFKIRG
ncbi:MAG: helix-turn-helix domain-containing protein [Selenomonadaceae bacterium]|nr:helix-turn-helix domain-containing protein [Selenomonadaceae bacterium]